MGVDPGVNGGYGVVDQDGVYVTSGPHHDLIFGLPDNLVGAAIEKQFVRPSDLRFGKVYRIQKLLIGFGEIMGFLKAYGVTPVEVAQSTWYAAHGIKTKSEILPTARRLWPHAPIARKKDDGVAVGLLLAEHLRRCSLG